jgi:hypothetical protein
MDSVINTNYKPNYKEKELHRFLTLFERHVREELEDKLNIFEVQAPLYSTKPIVSEIYETINSRLITFGTATDDELYSMYNKYDY